MIGTKPTKKRFLDRVAEKYGVAVVVLDESSNEVATANNNSVCAALYQSEEFGPRCAEYCGVAFARTRNSDAVFEYECHAGLVCKAVAVRDADKPFVAIVGRAFVGSEKYREATQKAIDGEWRRFKPTEFFSNILFAASAAVLDGPLSRLRRFAGVPEPAELLELPQEKAQPKAEPLSQQEPEPRSLESDIEEMIARFRAQDQPPRRTELVPAPASEQRVRRPIGNLLGMSLVEACQFVISEISERYNIASSMWLERRGEGFIPLVATGDFHSREVIISLDPRGDLIKQAVRQNRPVRMVERGKHGEAARHLRLFPVGVPSNIAGAIAISNAPESSELDDQILEIATSLGPQLEILRLRDEVAQRDWLAGAVKRFSENLKRIDTDDFWTHLTQISAELLQAERASLLIQSENSNELYAKAAIGVRTDLFHTPGIGARVAGPVLEQGSPVLVEDISKLGMGSAPLDWRYKTASFVSYPLLIGDRRIAVMNFTDKATGGSFDKYDLELLQAIAPQIAVAIDRTRLKDQAGQYKQLSVTDPLTGLLNRRYMDPRLAEEVKRSKRHGFPLALLLLDIDSFKSYNDTFGHPAGDSALRKVAEVLKGSLRAVDVAARWGGEEFAILLPNTKIDEAFLIAERIREEVESAEIPNRRITVSIGIAPESPEIGSSMELIQAADFALYEAKNRGRNTVCIFDVTTGSIDSKP